MARRNSVEELEPTFRAFESLRHRKLKRIGAGIDYSAFRCAPASPPVAKFLRNYVTLREALLRLRAETLTPRKQRADQEPTPEKWLGQKRTKIERLPDQKAFIQAGCSAVLEALGDKYPWDYVLAEDRLYEWSSAIFAASGLQPGQELSRTDSRPDVAAAVELEFLISRLIIAYSDPRRFFRETCPEDEPRDFDPLRLDDPQFLGLMLWRWGFGALMNDNVRHAFDTASADALIEIIGLAEGRTTYREGNPVGKGKGKPKKKRVDNVATKARINARASEIEKSGRQDRGGTKRAIGEIAREEDRSTFAIEKRKTRASNK